MEVSTLKYYLGLDNGGTSTKASLFTPDGKEVCTASTDTKMITSKPGFTERDMDEMWEANCKVIRNVISKSGIDTHDIASIACCGHGKGLYLWDKSGKPARNGIISTDRRAQQYVDRWVADGTEQKVFERSCQHIMACQPVALLAWLKDNEPETLENVQWVFECKDYVRFRLTGEAYAEKTDYSGANLMNLHTQTYDAELLRLFGLEDLMSALPPLKGSFDVCGSITEEVASLTGLQEGTPVAGGMFDIDACALAADVTDEDHVCMIAGTWSINEYIKKEPVTDGKVLMNSLFCMPGYYLIEESSATSAGNNEWFIQTLMPELVQQCRAEGTNIYKKGDELVESLSASDFCPTFFPFLMASNVNPDALGCFVGLSNYHTRAHILRSVYEGIAFSHKYHLDKLLATRDTPVKSIHLAGGAAHSKIWTQIFADVMQLDIETVEANETGTLGCAMAASVACGDNSDIRSAAKKMTKMSRIAKPVEENVRAYEKKYALYLKLIDALDPVWKEYAAMQKG
ncbi:MAG: carbohydrate kinase [Sphaerochaetaceae bacterium]|nr:carbohydrate kinase [Sphaerochaetaceae bacterium]